jgi:uncharacterized protein (TIGR03382 family)
MLDFGSAAADWARRLAAGFLACATLALPLAPAHAGIIIRADGFSTGGAASAFLELPGFDPELGTLQSVHVDISGVLSFNVWLQPGQTVFPIVQFDAFGLTGAGFAFSGSGARFMFDPVFNEPPPPEPGVTEVIPFVTSFTLDFTATVLTDFAGAVFAHVNASGASLVPPPVVDANLSDFSPNPLPLGILETLTFSPLGFTPVGGLNAAGVVILTYDYVDLHANPGTAISAPPSLGMFVLAVLALWHRRRRTMARPA